MTEVWETFELAPVPETSDLDRASFVATYSGRGPIIVRGGARATSAYERWDPGYLASAAGDAQVTVAEYAADRRDYGAIQPRRMPLREFLAELGQPATDVVRYLFNNETCIIARNEDQPRFHVGWAAQTNPGLASLTADFEVPPFVDPERFVVAVIILGSQENATDLHYDHGGEGKVLVQLRGRKRLLLLPPSSAEALRLNTLFSAPGTPASRSGSRPSLNVHAAADDPGPLSGVHGYTAELGPGDIAYWPPFWFHDLANLDPVTLAVGVMVDELTIPPLLMRHLTHKAYQALLSATARRRPAEEEFDLLSGGWNLEVVLNGRRVASLAELFSDVEARVLAEAPRDTDQLWEWNEVLPAR